MRLWPKWKSPRKLWGKPQEEEAKDRHKDIGDKMEAKMKRGMNKKQAKEAKERARAVCEGGCTSCRTNAPMDTWRSVKWRPVVAYSRHQLKGVLGMAARWSIFTIRSLGIGIAEDSARRVTEKVHEFNQGARSEADCQKLQEEKNQDNARKRRKNRRNAGKYRDIQVSRDLEKKIYDLSNFFISVPRGDFYRKALPEILEWIEKKFPGKPWY